LEPQSDVSTTALKLPNHRKAIIGEAKLVKYLLSPEHPLGRHKASFLRSFGFSAQAWVALARALLRHAAEHDVAKVEDSLFGKRYIIEGALRTPDGRLPLVRAVWFIEINEDRPRFVTAYALER
jgi:hypothetical protein